MIPDELYGAWWSIAAEEHGTPFYFAATNARPAFDDGTAYFVLGGDLHGAWEAYVYKYPTGQPFTYEALYRGEYDVAECEFET